MGPTLNKSTIRNSIKTYSQDYQKESFKTSRAKINTTVGFKGQKFKCKFKFYMYFFS